MEKASVNQKRTFTNVTPKRKLLRVLLYKSAFLDVLPGMQDVLGLNEAKVLYILII